MRIFDLVKSPILPFAAFMLVFIFTFIWKVQIILPERPIHATYAASLAATVIFLIQSVNVDFRRFWKTFFCSY